jgi:hypothetical protein
MGRLIHRVGAIVASAAAAGVVAIGISTDAAARPTTLGPSAKTTIEVAGRVTFTIALEKRGFGKFSVRGAIADSGKARAKKAVSRNRMRLTMTLRGRAGVMVILTSQTCGKLRSTWRVISGRREYKGLSGAGVGSGRAVCSGKSPYRSVLRGSVKTPPPGPLVTPGTYEGIRFGTNLRATFEVPPDGRTVTKVELKQLMARCEGQRPRFLDARFGGPFDIDANKRFAIVNDGYTISAGFGGSSARGTVAFQAGGCTVGPLEWSAVTPPAPTASVPTGRYCGFTLVGSGICLDATSDGWVANVRMGANLRCFEPARTTFQVEFNYQGVIAIQPADRSFKIVLNDMPLEGGTARWTLSGTFDGARGVTGDGGLSRVSLVRDGVRYTCRGSTTTWSAKLGA